MSMTINVYVVICKNLSRGAMFKSITGDNLD